MSPQKTLAKIADNLLDISKTWPEQAAAKKKEFLKDVSTLSALSLCMLIRNEGETGSRNTG